MRQYYMMTSVDSNMAGKKTYTAVGNWKQGGRLTNDVNGLD